GPEQIVRLSGSAAATGKAVRTNTSDKAKRVAVTMQPCALPRIWLPRARRHAPAFRQAPNLVRQQVRNRLRSFPAGPLDLTGHYGRCVGDVVCPALPAPLPP